jgi:hypothetical protein
MIEKSGLAAFEAQCIPTEPSVLGISDYKAFLQQRRVLVVQRLNQFLGVLKWMNEPISGEKDKYRGR